MAKRAKGKEERDKMGPVSKEREGGGRGKGESKGWVNGGCKR